MDEIAPQKRVYLDEAGIDDAQDYAYGYCQRGQRFQAQRQGWRRHRVSFMVVWNQHRLLAPMTFEGYCNRSAVETWLEFGLLPTLEPGQVLICNRVSFHQGGRIEQLVTQTGCRLMYLPAYSPGLNPIEWFVLKNRMRKRIQSGLPFRQVVDDAFLEYF